MKSYHLKMQTHCCLKFLSVTTILLLMILLESSAAFQRQCQIKRGTIGRLKDFHCRTSVALQSNTGEDEGGNEKDNAEISIKTQATEQQQQQQQQQLSSEQLMRAMGTSPRRIFLSVASSLGIALTGNLFGITSNVLKAIPEDVVESTGLDTYFPRGDNKRVNGREYSFIIPKEWVADTYIELAKAQRNAKTLDYKMGTTSNNGGGNTLPDAAYGPPGRLNSQGVSEQGDTNVSVIVSELPKGLSIKRALGNDPEVAAQSLLQRSIAPEGSGRIATLVNAFEDKDRELYQFEYELVLTKKNNRQLRAISVVATGTTITNSLITLTVLAPEKDWQTEKESIKLRKMADSFHLRQF